MYSLDRVMRSVNRDGKAMAMGLENVEKEIQYWETPKHKVRSVRQRLARLYAVRKQLVENPESSANLINQLKEIQNEGA